MIRIIRINIFTFIVLSLFFFTNCKKEKNLQWLKDLDQEKPEIQLEKLLNESAMIDSIELSNMDEFHPIIRQKLDKFIEYSLLNADTTLNTEFKEPVQRQLKRLFLNDTLINNKIVLFDSLTIDQYISDYDSISIYQAHSNVDSIKTISKFEKVNDSIYSGKVFFTLSKNNKPTKHQKGTIYLSLLNTIVGKDTVKTKGIYLGEIQDSLISVETEQ